MLDALPIAAYATDAEGRLTYFNRAAVDFSGRTPELGTDRWCVSWKLYDADGTPLPHDRCPMAVALKEGRPVSGAQAIAERPDGRRIPFRPYPMPLRDAGGTVVGALNLLVDISDEKRAEAQSEERYRQLLGLLPAAVYTCEAPSGVITFFNEHAAALWGRAPKLGERDEVFCGSYRLWRTDGSLLPHAETPMALAVKLGQSFRNEDVIIERPDGTRISVLVNIDPLRDASGALVGAINVFHDTTALRQAEEERRSAAELRAGLAAIVDSSDDAIVGKTLDGTIRSWNRGAERIFGYSAAEAVGRHITLIIPEERWAEEEDVLARLGRGEKIDHFETVRRTKDGRLLDISLTVSPIRDVDGRIIGASKIGRDITERKRIEAALREADRRKDEFLATLSHELRNPLAPIRNAVDLLREAGADPDIAAQATGILTRQVGHLARLVDDLLDVARISHGTLALERRSVQAETVVRTALEIAQPHLAAGGHALELDLPAQPLWLLADPVRLSQVLGNLLNNAARYTPGGGRICVSARAEGPQAAIRVRDNGSGIPAHMLERIFDMFATADAQSRRVNGGLGIGLSLARKLVELHGGTIEARSEGAGCGSEFVVRVPMVAGAEEPQAPAAGPAASPRRRVLIVDDNVDAAESLALVLERMGHEVELAHDGRSALDAAQRRVPEIVLLDIDLPRIDGYGVVARLRGDARFRRLRVIALTGLGRERDRARTREAGFDEHIVKPVDPDRLRELVEGALAA